MVGPRRRLAVLAVGALVALAACNPDPTGGARPPAAGAAGAPAFTTGAWPVARAEVTLSWRAGCPVSWQDLSNVQVAYWGYDGARHLGVLVVHDWLVPDVQTAFRRLYDGRFQIRRIHPVERWGADDDRSMAQNNTSAFNCRKVAGTNVWSEHAYGTAIDVNPIQNPYVRGGTVDPPAGREWTDRSSVVPGMVVRGDVAWRAFDGIGWGWGGDWTSKKDYQHFSLSGR